MHGSTLPRSSWPLSTYTTRASPSEISRWGRKQHTHAVFWCRLVSTAPSGSTNCSLDLLLRHDGHSFDLLPLVSCSLRTCFTTRQQPEITVQPERMTVNTCHLLLLCRVLQPENMLMHADGYIKVTDFGFAKEVAGGTYTMCGTPDYLAPEVIRAQVSIGYCWWLLSSLLSACQTCRDAVSALPHDILWCTTSATVYCMGDSYLCCRQCVQIPFSRALVNR